jgi:energy-converting hydrogenase Eha subunit B
MQSDVDPAPVGGALRARRALPLAERLRADAYGLLLVAVSAIASLPDRAELSRGSLVAGVVLAIATIVVIAPASD